MRAVVFLAVTAAIVGPLAAPAGADTGPGTLAIGSAGVSGPTVSGPVIANTTGVSASITGTGSAGLFTIGNTSSPSPAIFASTRGTGPHSGRQVRMRATSRAGCTSTAASA